MCRPRPPLSYHQMNESKISQRVASNFLAARTYTSYGTWREIGSEVMSHGSSRGWLLPNSDSPMYSKALEMAVYTERALADFNIGFSGGWWMRINGGSTFFQSMRNS